RVQCTNNMKQLGLAVLNFENAKRHLPLAYTPNFDGAQRFGPCNGGSPPSTTITNASNNLAKHFVLTFILPYIEQQTLYDRIDQNLNWNNLATSPKTGIRNRDATSVDVPDFLCPSADQRPNAYTTDYYTVVDVNDVAYCSLIEGTGLAKTRRSVDTLLGMLGDTPIPIRRVTDGMSKTFMLFESAGRPNHYDHTKSIAGTMTSEYQWADDRVYALIGNSANPNCPLTSFINCDNYQGIYSFHPGGVVQLMGGGSAFFMNENIEGDTFISLFTRAADDLPGAY
ncbi:MAG TPA: DUF1559 domain-containing protein, partial [Lacipirellulaceae bacterium]|nr:DUF1559 domain-containing protein [Lacipirellulaceae bacterium]